MTGSVRRRRSGAILSVELLMVTPVVVFFAIGVFQLLQLLQAKQALAQASREAARAAAITGSAEMGQFSGLRALAPYGPLAHASVTITFSPTTGTDPEPRRLVLATISAPSGLAVLNLPPFTMVMHPESPIVAHTVMRVE